MLPLVGADRVTEPPGGGDGSSEGGGIKGVLTECTSPTAGSMVYLNGHSFVVFIGISALPSNQAAGAYEMHHVPPGTYDVILEVPNLEPRVVKDVHVTSGQITNLDPVDICWVE